MGSGFDSQTWRHMWVEFVDGSRPSSEGFSPGSLVSLPPQKSTFLNSNSIWKSRATGLSVEDCYNLPSLNKVNLFICDRELKKKSKTKSFIRPCHTAAILSQETKRALFYQSKPPPTVLTARLGVVKQSFFGLPGQYRCRVTRANSVPDTLLIHILDLPADHGPFRLYGSHFECYCYNGLYNEMLRKQIRANLPLEHPIIKLKTTPVSVKRSIQTNNQIIDEGVNKQIK